MSRFPYDRTGDELLTLMEPADTFEHAGLYVEIVAEEEDAASADPQQNDNAGTIVVWGGGREYSLGDEQIAEPDWEKTCEHCDGSGEIRASTECPMCDGYGAIECSIEEWFHLNYDAELVIRLRFADHRYYGEMYPVDTDDDANAVIVFTNVELLKEWDGSREDARTYALARVAEYSDWLEGNVFGIVVRDREGGEVLESVWGFIGDIYGESGKHIREEAQGMAVDCARQIERERAEAHRWACADVVTTYN